MSETRYPYPWNKGYYRCDPCYLDDTVCFAQEYCQACEEKLCKDCAKQHRSRKATSCHTLLSIQKLITTEHFICMQCRKNNKLDKPTQICIPCKVCLCDDCMLSHSKQLGNHALRTIVESPPVNFDKLIPFCDICKGKSSASYVCNYCEENLCNDCTYKHCIRKATKSHTLTQVSLSKNEEEKQCRNVDDSYVGRHLAVNVCTVCQETLCDHCTETHRQKKSPAGHNIRPVVDKYSTCEQCELIWKMYKPQDTQLRPVEEQFKKAPSPQPGCQRIERSQRLNREDQLILPGKPVASNVRADAVALTWEHPLTFSPGNNYYQLTYKEIDRNKYWKNYPDKFFAESAEVDGLRSNTAFVFRVRAVYTDQDGPLSIGSDEIVTLESPACRYTARSLLLQRRDPSPYVFAVPIKMVETEKSDKGNVFEIGTRPLLHCKSKTILLMGAPEAGKSTLIDAMINYVLGVSWDDPYRFTVKQSVKEFFSNTQSHTEMWTRYTIYPEKEGRLQYTLNVIDTHKLPSFSFFMRDPYPVRDVSCFVVRASDTRLTAQQRRLFMVNPFFFSSKGDRTTLITFADGNAPPVLSALSESIRDFGEIFKFNNSSLFAKNENISWTSISRVFWDMGFKSFKAFFDHIETLNTGNIDEQTLLQAMMKESQLQFVKVLSMASVLKQSIDDIKENQSLKGSYIKDVSETFKIIQELPAGEVSINCISCQHTCHTCSNKVCGTYNTLVEKGKCKYCNEKCPLKNHYKSGFKCENVEIETRYEEFTKDKDVYKTLYGLSSDLNKLKEILKKIASSLITCDKRLKQIELLPESCVITIKEYIKWMIEDEIHERKDGFLMRVCLLYHLFEEYKKFISDEK